MQIYSYRLQSLVRHLGSRNRACNTSPRGTHHVYIPKHSGGISWIFGVPWLQFNPFSNPLFKFSWINLKNYTLTLLQKRNSFSSMERNDAPERADFVVKGNFPLLHGINTHWRIFLKAFLTKQVATHPRIDQVSTRVGKCQIKKTLDFCICQVRY